MNKQQLIFGLLLLFSWQISQAQITKNFYVGLGGQASSFQDLKYSSVRYGGVGGSLQIGTERISENAIRGFRFSIGVSNELAATNELNSATVFNPTVSFHYLRRINEQLAVGLNWDLLDFYLRNTQGLGNNSFYAITSSDLSFAARYQWNKFSFQAQLGVLTLVRESTGFAFSAPQNALEEGEFDYQNSAIENPFSPKYADLDHLFNHLNIQTEIRYQFNDRLSLAYQWSVRKFAEVKNAPVTYGYSAVVIRYNLQQKEKFKS